MVLASAKIVRRRPKQRTKNGGGKRNLFFNDLFQWEQIFFPKIFFLFLMYNYRKFMMKKEKSRKKDFSMGKKTVKRSLVILSALVIYTYRADCRCTVQGRFHFFPSPSPSWTKDEKEQRLNLVVEDVPRTLSGLECVPRGKRLCFCISCTADAPLFR